MRCPAYGLPVNESNCEHIAVELVYDPFKPGNLIPFCMDCRIQLDMPLFAAMYSTLCTCIVNTERDIN